MSKDSYTGECLKGFAKCNPEGKAPLSLPACQKKLGPNSSEMLAKCLADEKAGKLNKHKLNMYKLNIKKAARHHLQNMKAKDEEEEDEEDEDEEDEEEEEEEGEEEEEEVEEDEDEEDEEEEAVSYTHLTLPTSG